MRLKSLIAPLAAALICSAAMARVIGTMVPAVPLSEMRVKQLPQPEQRAWMAYLARSKALMAADKAALIAERRNGAALSAPLPGRSGGEGMPLDKPADWYASAEARRVADTVVSFQTPAGGWGKNMDRTGPRRALGQFWVPVEKLPPEAQQDIQALDKHWVYVGTFDNGATTSEMRFLARVQSRFPGKDGDAYRQSFLKGVRYLLTAQFPNGGWPQVFPLQGGYHDAITYNDGALSEVATVLSEAASRRGDYAFVSAHTAEQASAAVRNAVDIVLATQVVVNGKPTIWGQQHDALTLAPVGARNFEPASLATAESAEIVTFLMEVPEPSPRIVAAVDAAVAWFRENAIRDVEWARATDTQPRRLVPKRGALTWARFHDLKSFKPIFGDRDKTIRDNVEDLIVERRNGYSWYGSAPASAIKKYEKWRAKLPKAERG